MKLNEMILAAQNYDESAMNALIKKFKPAIDSHTRKMEGDEDFRSDMILFFIGLIRRLDLSSLRSQTDPAIIKYISKSLHNQYILLSKKQTERRTHENLYDPDDLERWLGADYEAAIKLEDLLIESLMSDTLTKREYICVRLTVIEGMKSSQVAEMLGITRQTANEAKHRGLGKLISALQKESRQSDFLCLDSGYPFS